jgi:hypothetical protein
MSKPSSAYAYDPGVIRLDLCNQIHWIVFQTEIKNPAVVDSAYMNNRLFELHRRAKRRREIIYFVIDGLDEIPTENEFILESILDILPIGLPGFGFIFSAQEGILSEKLTKRKVKVKPLTLSGFAFDEALSVFPRSYNRQRNPGLAIVRVLDAPAETLEFAGFWHFKTYLSPNIFVR